MKTECMNVEQKLLKMFIHIHHFTDKNFMLVSFASIIGALGYLYNKYTVIIGTKLISTSIYPFILLALLGESLNFKHMSNPIINIVGILVLPLIISLIMGTYHYHYTDIKTPTTEMIHSTEHRSVIVEFIVAFAVGVAYYLAIDLRNLIVFIGLLLCITIIPALVNAGLYYSFALNNYIYNKNNTQITNENIHGGNINMEIFFANAIGILLGMALVFYISC